MDQIDEIDTERLGNADFFTQEFIDLFDKQLEEESRYLAQATAMLNRSSCQNLVFIFIALFVWQLGCSLIGRLTAKWTVKEKRERTSTENNIVEEIKELRKKVEQLGGGIDNFAACARAQRRLNTLEEQLKTVQQVERMKHEVAEATSWKNHLYKLGWIRPLIPLVLSLPLFGYPLAIIPHHVANGALNLWSLPVGSIGFVPWIFVCYRVTKMIVGLLL